MRFATLALALLVTACGASGPPEPVAPEHEPGIDISGTAEIGIVGGGF